MRTDSSLPPGGGPVATTDFAQAVVAADHIVVATITRVDDSAVPVTLLSPDARPGLDRTRVADLTIHRNMAGIAPPAPAHVLFLEGTLPSRPWLVLTSGETVLLCLRTTLEGNVPLPLTGSTLLTRPDLPSAPPGLDRRAAVAHELEQLILTCDPDREADLIARAGEARAELALPIDLAKLSTPAARAPQRRMALLAAALGGGQLQALTEMGTLPAATSASPVHQRLERLLLHLVSTCRDPAALPYMLDLTRHPRADLAQSAITALRGRREPTVAAALVTALNHPDQAVRYQAVLGLAELDPSVPDGGPALPRFRRDEPGYLKRWKAWWQARRV